MRDFLLLKKQVKYKFKKKEMASEILRMIIDTEAFNNEMVRDTPMSISLKEAYSELIVMVFLLNKITQSNNLQRAFYYRDYLACFK